MKTEEQAIMGFTKYGDPLMRYEPFRPSVLKALRAEKGISQKELAEMSGVPEPTIKRIESGAGSPNFETLKLLGKFFNLFLYPDWTEDEESPSV